MMPIVSVGVDAWTSHNREEVYLLMDRATTVETVEAGIERALADGRTDKVMVFDGSYGHITCNEPMAELLRSRAPEVDRVVEHELLPKWLSQRCL